MLCPLSNKMCFFFQQNFVCGSSKKVAKKCDHLLYVTYFQDMLEGVWGGFPKNNSGQYKQGRHWFCVSGAKILFFGMCDFFFLKRMDYFEEPTMFSVPNNFGMLFLITEYI